MSEEELQEEVTDQAASDLEPTVNPEGEEQPFGQDSDVDGNSDSPDAPAEETTTEDSSAGTFDVSGLPEIEANYANSTINELIERALKPIDGDQPCGDSEAPAESVISQIETTMDSIHDSLRSDFGDAVRDDTTLSFEMSSSGRDASELVDQIVDCLENQCKSAILASYLPHLMLIEYGLPGFSAGLDIFRELIQRYSPILFPRDQERLKSYLRRGVYVGNDDKVTDNFKLFLYYPITEHNRLPYALLRNSRIRGANTDVEGKYANDASNSSVAYYVTLIGDLNHMLESARQANQSLNELLNDPMFEIVSFSFLESLERMDTIVTSLATENCSGYPPVEEEAIAEADASTGTAAPAAVAGEIANREQAIDLLKRIADFFHRTERHSPVSYRIRETIRWCKMDLPELLQELLSDDQGPLDELGKRVGFRGLEQDHDQSEYDG